MSAPLWGLPADIISDFWGAFGLNGASDQLTRGPWAVSMAHWSGAYTQLRTADKVQAARSPNNFFTGCPLNFDLPPPP